MDKDEIIKWLTTFTNSLLMPMPILYIILYIWILMCSHKISISFSSILKALISYE